MIAFSNVSFSYHTSSSLGESTLADESVLGSQLLNDVTITLEPGKKAALVGKNGSGKSTIAQLAAALRLPTCGEVLVDGINTATTQYDELLAIRQRVALVGQDPLNQMVASTVFDEVAFGPCNLCLPSDEVSERVHQSLQQVGLLHALDRDPATFSGGELQRLALAGVLAMEPQYLVLDETGSMLDEESHAHLMALLDNLVQQGIGVLFITHDQSVVAQSDIVYGLADGHVTCYSSVDKFLRDDDCLDRFGLALRPDCVVSGSRARIKQHQKDRGQSAQSNTVVVDRVSLAYNARTPQQKTVVRQASFAIEPGSITLVTGKSGSGKSTLLQAVAGLLDPDEGQIYWSGCGTQKPVQAGQIGYAFQDARAQLFAMTVFEDVVFAALQNKQLALKQSAALSMQRGSYSDDGSPVHRSAQSQDNEYEAMVRRALAAVDLDFEKMRDVSPLVLSGGQARRVALAGIIITQPQVICLDEPTVGLDGSARSALFDLMRSLSDMGISLLIATHNIQELMPIASQHVHIDEKGYVQCHCVEHDEKGSVSRLIPCGAQQNQAMVLSRQKQENRNQPYQSAAVIGSQNFEMIGLYQPEDTPLHRFDARLKIAGMLVASILLLAVHQWAGMVLALIIVAGLFHVARVKTSSLKAGMLPFSLVLMVMFATHAFTLSGADFELIGSFGLTFSGAMRGALYVVRIGLLVALSLILTTTTSSAQLMDAFIWMTKPLRKTKIPIDDLVTTAHIALRFIPETGRELNRIVMSQRARGINFEQGSVIQRLRLWTTVFIPLLVSLFRRAMLLAQALEARCYGLMQRIDPRCVRTTLTSQQISFRQMLIFAIFLLVFAIMALKF